MARSKCFLTEIDRKINKMYETKVKNTLDPISNAELKEELSIILEDAEITKQYLDRRAGAWKGKAVVDGIKRVMMRIDL